MSLEERIKKPPLELMPKHQHKVIVGRKRLHDIQGAISRRYNEEVPIPIEWVEEYNELLYLINE